MEFALQVQQMHPSHCGSLFSPRTRRESLSQCTAHDRMVETNLNLQSWRRLAEWTPADSEAWVLKCEWELEGGELGWRNRQNVDTAANLATWRPATTGPLLGSGSARLEITRASLMGCEISMAEVTLAPQMTCGHRRSTRL